MKSNEVDMKFFNMPVHYKGPKTGIAKANYLLFGEEIYGGPKF